MTYSLLHFRISLSGETITYCYTDDYTDYDLYREAGVEVITAYFEGNAFVEHDTLVLMDDASGTDETFDEAGRFEQELAEMPPWSQTKYFGTYNRFYNRLELNYSASGEQVPEDEALPIIKELKPAIMAFNPVVG